jgi:hypothetical protein
MAILIGETYFSIAMSTPPTHRVRFTFLRFVEATAVLLRVFSRTQRQEAIHESRSKIIKNRQRSKLFAAFAAFDTFDAFASFAAFAALAALLYYCICCTFAALALFAALAAFAACASGIHYF